MSKSGVDSKKLDPVAEVLSSLSKGDKVTKDKARQALEHHNNQLQTVKEDAKEVVYRSLERNKVELKRKEDEIKRLQEQIKEQNMRVAQLAGDKIVKDNPDLTNLSDPYRPTKLVESFGQVYDDDWTRAFEDLEQTQFLEREIICCLANLLRAVEKFCDQAASQQIKRMQDDIRVVVNDITQPKFQTPEFKEPVTTGDTCKLTNADKEMICTHIKQLRKSLARSSLPGLIKIFDSCFLKKLAKEYKFDRIARQDGVKTFAEKSIELIWMMKIQDVPMVLKWATTGEKFDKAKFTEYTKKGDVIDYSVWPAVLLHTDGPLMAKGVVQCKTK